MATITIDEKIGRKIFYGTLVLAGAALLNFCAEFGGNYINEKRNERLMMENHIDYYTVDEEINGLEIEKKKIGLENVEIEIRFDGNIPSAEMRQEGNKYFIFFRVILQNPYQWLAEILKRK